MGIMKPNLHQPGLDAGAYQRVRGVGDELAVKDFRVGIEGADDQLRSWLTFWMAFCNARVSSVSRGKLRNKLILWSRAEKAVL
jgi:hypothetical protein